MLARLKPSSRRGCDAEQSAARVKSSKRDYQLMLWLSQRDMKRDSVGTLGTLSKIWGVKRLRVPTSKSAVQAHMIRGGLSDSDRW